jgi:aminoacrylate hydrolase
MTEIVTGDTRLHVVRRGEGPPLLLIVGLGGRSDFWSGTIDHMADRFDCISFDHRKTGKSGGSDVVTRVSVLAEDALAVLDAMGIAQADIIGHSLGGAIAQHIAVHAPERVKRLVLSASWAGPTDYFKALFDLRRQVLQQCGAEAYLMHGNTLGNPGWWGMAHHATMMAGIGARLKAFAGTATEMERMDAIDAHDLRDRLPGVRAETMVICARDDSITPLPLSEELARLIPGARLEILETGNHFAPVTTPALWRARVDGFLNA